jgi:hypothetical protein
MTLGGNYQFSTSFHPQYIKKKTTEACSASTPVKKSIILEFIQFLLFLDSWVFKATALNDHNFF